MTMWMYLFLVFVIGQRIGELMITKRNEHWMKQHGGVEKGKAHYKWFVIVHVLFFLSLVTEASLRGNTSLPLNAGLLTVFILVQIGRVWCITSLGRFWNTKIIVLSSVSVIQKGPYKYVKHPNYIIVAIEMIVIPLLFGAYYTAILFPLAHLLLLRLRIPAEDKALAMND